MLIDGVPYSFLSANEIAFTGKEKLDAYLFLRSATHRQNIARKANSLKPSDSCKIDFLGTMYNLNLDGSIDSKIKAEATTVMNKKADLNQIDEALRRNELEHAELLKKKSEEQAQPAAPVMPAPVAPALMPQQPAPGVGISAITTAAIFLFRVAGIDEVAPEAKAMIDQLVSIGNHDSNATQEILQLLDAARSSLESCMSQDPQVGQAPVATVEPVEGFVAEQANKPLLNKQAGENPFAKKDDEKEEPKEESKDEDKKEDKDPEDFGNNKPPKSQPSSDESKKEEPKKEGKPEPKKEEKKDAPKKDDEKDEKESYEMSKSEEKGAKKAIKVIEDLIKKEKKEGLGEVESLEKALEEVKKFLFEEKEECPLGMPGMELGKDLPGLCDKPALDIMDPHKADILVTSPAVPLPVKEPLGGELGMGKPALPVGMKPVNVIKPVAPKMDMAKDMGNTLAFSVNDYVWSRMAGENIEIGDEPGRVIELTNDKVVVDWGNDVPTEENASDLIKAAEPTTTENLFQNVSDVPVGEFATGMNAFTPASQEVQKVLSSMNFADMMAKHVSSMDEEGAVYRLGTNQKGEVVSAGKDGKVVVKFGDTTTEVWPCELMTTGK